jgi:folate-dependent phosphoribosylglycinamide formyltransferase PurN
MRIVVLCSSPYSETGCAMAARLAQLGQTPVGAITLPSWDRGTLLSKFGQWGIRESARFAWSKLSPGKAAGEEPLRNRYLTAALQRTPGFFRNLHEVAGAYGFPVLTSPDQNSEQVIGRMRSWSPDLAIFTGGDILRKALLQTPRLGVINAHLALLPEIRGMSSPEWSLLRGVPVGITIHFVDSGIDTGPILQRREFSDASHCESLTDLRNRMIACGIEMVGEVVAALEAGTRSPVPQSNRDHDNQFFVMHDRLKAQAARRLKQGQPLSVAGGANE